MVGRVCYRSPSHAKVIRLSRFTPSSLRRAEDRAGFAVRAIEPDRAMVEPARRVIDAWRDWGIACPVIRARKPCC